ncbi:MAG: hypothetical protein ACE5M4_09260 [Anaerolineales bacterium]
MAISAALLVASVSPLSGVSEDSRGQPLSEVVSDQHQPASLSSETLGHLDLACDQAVQHELPSDSNVTWRLAGQPGDVLSIRYQSSREGPNPEFDLQLEDQSLLRAAAYQNSSHPLATQSFLLPREGTYSFTVMSDEKGVAYEIALACEEEDAHPTPSPIPAPSPTPEPTPESRADALRARIREVEAVGDVVVSLVWMSVSDLDLHVIDPRGEEIYFENRRSLTGGLLEYEANGSCIMATTEPIESIYWKASTAPRGKYEVKVHHYASCMGEEQLVFVVGIWVEGKLVETIEGTIAPSEFQSVYEFNY